MTEIPRQLEVMRSVVGTQWSSGSPSPAILAWEELIATTYPVMANYIRSIERSYIAWCGLTVAYCMTVAGIRPQFGDGDDENKFLWARAWLQFGTAVDTPRPGDVMIFDFGGGDWHVTLFNGGGDDTHYECLGGNQSHQVKTSNYAKSQCKGIRRPPQAAVSQAPAPAIKPSDAYKQSLAYVLADEGGNDDDPRDPGGRTSRGILQREWDVWRKSHPGLPSDVWQAPQGEIEAIYKAKYWDVLCCDQLPAGVDYCVFDYGVNSGIGRSAKVLQGIVGTDQDGEIGPLTIAAAARADAQSVITRMCDERMSFLQGLRTWPTFGRGWTNRVNGVRKHAAAMAVKKKETVMSDKATDDQVANLPAPAAAAPQTRLDVLGTLFNFIKFASGPESQQLINIALDVHNRVHPDHVAGPAAQPTPAPAAAAAPPAAPSSGISLNRLSVHVSAVAAAIGAVLQGTGKIPMPSLPGADGVPSLVGNLTTIVPYVSLALGALGTWGKIGGGALTVLTAIADAARKPPKAS